MYMQINEENVIDLLQRNVNDAFFFLYKKMYGSLCSFSFYYIRNSDVANDIVQDIFVSLLDINKEFSSYSELKFYLYKAVKNRSINHLRHEAVKEGYSNELVKSYEDPDLFYSKMLEEDVYSNLIFAINHLPPKCKSVIKLTMEGYKTTEIAEKLSISSETVKEHKSNAKNKLKASFKSIDKVFIIIWIISNLR